MEQGTKQEQRVDVMIVLFQLSTFHVVCVHWQSITAKGLVRIRAVSRPKRTSPFLEQNF